MTLCKSREEIAALWPCETRKLVLSRLPKKFPCFVKFHYMGFELPNGHYVLEICCPPDGVDLESFNSGLTAKKEIKGNLSR